MLEVREDARLPLLQNRARRVESGQLRENDSRRGRIEAVFVRLNAVILGRQVLEQNRVLRPAHVNRVREYLPVVARVAQQPAQLRQNALVHLHLLVVHVERRERIGEVASQGGFHDEIAALRVDALRTKTHFQLID